MSADERAPKGDRRSDGAGSAPKRFDPRVNRGDRLSTAHHDGAATDAALRPEAEVDLGWGRVIFGHTFRTHDALVSRLLDEPPGRRDIAMYIRDPHILVGLAPTELFIDPSLTYRLWLHRYRARPEPIRGVVVRPMDPTSHVEQINRIYATCGMVTADPPTMIRNHRGDEVTVLVAVDAETGEVLGTVTGIDHEAVFDDPEQGTSLWSLAVDRQSSRPRVGEALIRNLLERFVARGRAYLDLSVLHDNSGAIRLYEKLGFERVPVFAVKRKNPINESLYTPPGTETDLNPYARIIADEAHRRGITVTVIDAESGLMELSSGGRTISTRESLSELTTAVAMTRCDDKRLTRRLLSDAGLRVPAGRLAGESGADLQFLTTHGEIVVKPVRGEQGQGVTVGIRDPDAMLRAIEGAQRICPDVLLEELIDGEDLRVVVIDFEVVAASIRRPPQVVGDGRHTVLELVRAQSRRREAATDGESTIKLDEHALDTLAEQGVELGDVLEEGHVVRVRRTANLHTGGTIHDCTDRLHPVLAAAAVDAAKALDIPVVGVDLLVPDVEAPDYVIIEANERPGLANHEPRPTAQAFIDLLFPRTKSLTHQNHAVESTR